MDQRTYHGITYRRKHRSEKALKRWRITRCRKNQHLFYECLSSDEHYLSCDACGLAVFIERIDTTHQTL